MTLLRFFAIALGPTLTQTLMNRGLNEPRMANIASPLHPNQPSISRAQPQKGHQTPRRVHYHSPKPSVRNRYP